MGHGFFVVGWRDFLEGDGVIVLWLVVRCWPIAEVCFAMTDIRGAGRSFI